MKKAVESKKRESLLSLEKPPQVIEMYVGFEKVKLGNDPIYYTAHLGHWLREYGVTSAEESNKSYKDISLPKEVIRLLGVSIADIFGNYAFLFPEVKVEDLESIVEALKQASCIFWDRHGKHSEDFHEMRLVESLDSYSLLRGRLFDLLDGGMSCPRKKEEVEKIAEYFVLFCEGDRSVLKELAMQYFFTGSRFEDYRRSTPCDD
ncbi:MAG: hypothetical protein Q8Q95_01210 [bacterium]|nr:hypothetical protein [bacterium]